MTPTKPPFWHKGEWICTNHVPWVYLPKNTLKCWFHKCPSVRPPLVEPTQAERRRGATHMMHCSVCKAIVWRRKSEEGTKVFCALHKRGATPTDQCGSPESSRS